MYNKPVSSKGILAFLFQLNPIVVVTLIWFFSNDENICGMRNCMNLVCTQCTPGKHIMHHYTAQQMLILLGKFEFFRCIKAASNCSCH